MRDEHILDFEGVWKEIYRTGDPSASLMIRTMGREMSEGLIFVNFIALEIIRVAFPHHNVRDAVWHIVPRVSQLIIPMSANKAPMPSSTSRNTHYAHTSTFSKV